MIGITPIMMRNSLGISPMPSQMMNNGMKASGGSGLSTSMTGSIACLTTRLADMPAPAATPVAVPAVKRMRTLSGVPVSAPVISAPMCRPAW